ncbi:MAG: SRPBCC domain-containing protein [Flavobacteriaceae bacterium]|nr:SRPBCC domain-containing protein [Flavobacteriaceae bacterium]
MRTKFEIEYPLRTSEKILYKRLNTASGLAEWFADNVTRNGSVFSFTWNESVQKAKQIEYENSKKVAFQWLDGDNEGITFSFLLKTNEITNSLALIVTDFADEDEVDETIALWDKQINVLKRKLGI